MDSELFRGVNGLGVSGRAYNLRIDTLIARLSHQTLVAIFRALRSYFFLIPGHAVYLHRGTQLLWKQQFHVLMTITDRKLQRSIKVALKVDSLAGLSQPEVVKCLIKDILIVTDFDRNHGRSIGRLIRLLAVITTSIARITRQLASL